MKNTELFFKTCKKYQDERNNINAAFEKRMQELKPMAGSEYFKSESTKAQTERDNALKALKAECGESLNGTLERMARTNRQRPMKAPTAEELNILQLLKLKDNISEQELESAAIALKGNPTCLSALTEIGRKAGYLRGYNHYAESKEMSIEETEGALRQLAKNVNDFIEFDTKKTARIAEQIHSNLYGKGESRPLPKRPLFETKRECFETLGLNSSTLDELFAVVDAEGGNNE